MKPNRKPRCNGGGSALGSPPTDGGRKVTNYRDRRVAPNDCVRLAPTAAVALVSSLAVRIPVQVRPRWEPLPSPEFNTPAGAPGYFAYTSMPLQRALALKQMAALPSGLTRKCVLPADR